jgi:hypothetical protein
MIDNLRRYVFDDVKPFPLILDDHPEIASFRAASDIDLRTDSLEVYGPEFQDFFEQCCRLHSVPLVTQGSAHIKGVLVKAYVSKSVMGTGWGAPIGDFEKEIPLRFPGEKTSLNFIIAIDIRK